MKTKRITLVVFASILAPLLVYKLFGFAPVYHAERFLTSAYTFIVIRFSDATVDQLNDAIRQKRHRDIQEILVNNRLANEKDESGKTPLRLAIELNNVDAVNMLLGVGADPNELQAADGKSLLSLAAENRRQTQMIKRLVASGADMELPDINGNTPLHIASQVGNYHAVSSLVELGSNLDARDSDGRTPLINAAMRGHKRAAIVLIDAGANIEFADHEGKTALDYAAKYGMHDQVFMALNAKMGEKYDFSFIEFN